MPQLSLYLDKKNYSTILAEAKKANMSLSKWAAKKIFENTKPSFPVGYEKLCGSFSDDELQEPNELSWGLDSARESL